MVGQEPRPKDVAFAARTCAAVARKTGRLAEAAHAQCLIRGWGDDTRREVERLASEMLKRPS